MEVGDLLRHGSADGLLQFVQGVLGIGRLRLVRIQRIRRHSKETTSRSVDSRITDPVGEQQLLHAFEDRVPAAGQEGGQVRVHFGAQLSAMFPTLQLDAVGEMRLSISLATIAFSEMADVCWMTHSSRMELISGVKNFSLDSPSDVLAA